MTYKCWGDRVGKRALPFIEGACSVNHGAVGASPSPRARLTQVRAQQGLSGGGGGNPSPGTGPARRLLGLSGAKVGWPGGSVRAGSQGLTPAMAGGSPWSLSGELGQGLGRAGLSSQTESEQRSGPGAEFKTPAQGWIRHPAG